MPVGIGLGQQDAQSLTSKFLQEALDPPHRLIAVDGDATPILAEQMRTQEPGQAVGNMALTALVNLLRSDDKDEQWQPKWKKRPARSGRTTKHESLGSKVSIAHSETA